MSRVIPVCWKWLAGLVWLLGSTVLVVYINAINGISPLQTLDARVNLSAPVINSVGVCAILAALAFAFLNDMQHSTDYKPEWLSRLKWDLQEVTKWMLASTTGMLAILLIQLLIAANPLPVDPAERAKVLFCIAFLAWTILEMLALYVFVRWARPTPFALLVPDPSRLAAIYAAGLTILLLWALN